MTKPIVVWIIRRFFELWVILIAFEIIYGLVGIWVVLDGTDEPLIMADFIFAAILSWLLLVTGFLAEYTFKTPVHPRLAQIYLVFYSLTVLTVIFYCFRPLGYLHAPIQRDVYDMFLTPTAHRKAMLFLVLTGLGLASLPQLLCRHAEAASDSSIHSE